MIVNFRFLLHTLIVLFNSVLIFNTNAQLYINEVQASNKTTIVDNFLDYDDWIEIYNTGNNSINLAGYYLSDNINHLTKYKIPNTNSTLTTVPANGYLIFWADDNESQGINHTNFKLSSSGESIFLVNPDAVTIIDSLSYTAHSTDQTYKRIPDGSSNVTKSTMASPLSTNNNDAGLLEAPVFSISSGVYPSSQVLTLIAEPGATIYFTTNGVNPGPSSTIYSGPISISQNASIKAYAVKSGFANSETVTATYLINTNHSLPIVNLSIDPFYLYDDSLGMYTTGTNGTFGPCSVTANFYNDFEYEANVTLFETDGTIGFNENCGLEMSGACSRNFAKKSFNIGFKSKYGKSKLKYKLFEDSDADEFDGFKLRTGGNKAFTEYQLDALAQKYIENELDIDHQYSRPVVLYLNGNYWGIYFIKDRLNTGYAETYYPKYEDPELDMIKFPKADTINSWHWVQETVMSGSNTTYNNLFDYASNNNLNIPSNYNYIKSQIDINSLIDYLSVMIFYSKHDWPANNLKVWKSVHPSSKWRWMMFDMDFFGTWGIESLNFLQYLLVEDIPAYQFHNTSKALFKNLFENDEFKSEFVQRSNTYINTIWDSSRVQQIADNFNNKIAPEVSNNYLRWLPEQTSHWNESTFFANKNKTVDYISQRPPFWRSMVDSFLNVSGRINLTYNFNSTTNGKIAVNANFFNINENLTVTYHQNVPLWIHAIPDPGYRFVEWQELTDPSIKYKQSIYTGFNSNQTLTPIFEPALDLVINEIHYNPLGTLETEEFIELYNPDANAKPLYGYQFDNGVEFTFPENAVINAYEYIIIAKDASLYNGNGYQVFQWECGSLNNDGERVFFSNPTNMVIDSVKYNDNIDWDEDADGLDFSLALLDHSQDNAQPSAWASQAINFETTPGAVNNFCEPISNSSTIAQVSCFGAGDGFIVSQISGGTAPFTYSWSNGATTNINSNLAPATYTLNIIDFYNCPYTETFSISEPSVLTATTSSTNETHYQTNNGTASITVTGGIPPYTYNWSNGATTSSVNNLAPGNHIVHVFDANACSINKSFVISGIACNTISVNVTTRNETCFNEGDGLLIVNSISNGTVPYSILWSTGITGTVANNLTANIYQLNVEDAFGCPYQKSYAIEADHIIDASFNINNVSSANLSDGSIVATPAGGSAPYTFNWSNSTSNQNLSNIGMGSYTVTITDANGCSSFFDQLIIGNSCIPSIVQQNSPVINSQVYQVAQFIQSNGLVNANEQVNFKAGDYIELNNDFEIKIGAEFEALIEGCE